MGGLMQYCAKFQGNLSNAFKGRSPLCVHCGDEHSSCAGKADSSISSAGVAIDVPPNADAWRHLAIWSQLAIPNSWASGLCCNAPCQHAGCEIASTTPGDGLPLRRALIVEGSIWFCKSAHPATGTGSAQSACWT